VAKNRSTGQNQHFIEMLKRHFEIHKPCHATLGTLHAAKKTKILKKVLSKARVMPRSKIKKFSGISLVA
jgi:hypothetical protein